MMVLNIAYFYAFIFEISVKKVRKPAPTLEKTLCPGLPLHCVPVMEGIAITGTK